MGEVELSDFGSRGEYGQIKPRPYRRGGFDRERRLQNTLIGGAVILLVVGLGIGFALGRATAPRTTAQVPSTTAEPTTSAATTEATLPVDTSVTDETSVTADTTTSLETTLPDTVAPPKPTQLAPSNGAVIDTSRVTLRWSKVVDDSGAPVTYAFEIQTRIGGAYGSNAQTIKGLTSTSYSARVLPQRRRWRVWAVDAAGNSSAKSPWHTYIHSVAVPKKSTGTSSTATTGTN